MSVLFQYVKIHAGTCNSKFHLFFTEKQRSEYMSLHPLVKRKLPPVKKNGKRRKCPAPVTVLQILNWIMLRIMTQVQSHLVKRKLKWLERKKEIKT